MSNKRFSWPASPKASENNIVEGKKYRFTVLTDRLVRMEYVESGKFVDNATQSVLNRDFPDVNFTVKNWGDKLIIETRELVLTYIENAPFSAETLTIKLKNEPASEWKFGEDFEDLGGTAKTLDETAGPANIGRGIISRYGFSILDDKDRMLLNEDGWVECRESGTEDMYFFGYGYNYFEAIKDYFKLTGEPPMLPAYALGNWWSRYHKYTQDEYKELMLRFKEEDIPFSVGVIDMDWHLVDIDESLKPLTQLSPHIGWTGYTWNEELFPDHKALLQFLHDENIKVSLNLHPADGVRRHEAMYKQMAEACGIDPESGDPVYLDILNPDFMEKYFDIIHHPYEEEGVDFWWMDWQQGNGYGWIHEPNKNGELKDPREVLDPLWMLNHLHILDITRDGKRPMFFSRFSGPGSQRYPVGFSGDAVVCWEALDAQPCFTSTASNIGYGWWSHDIGGHQAGYRDDELAVRWLQFGVLSPVNRLHSTNSELNRKEPWCYEKGTELIMRDWLRLRHELFPYLYTMTYRNHTELVPLIVPMYYTHPKCSGAYEAKNQYWFGSELIVAPITEHSDSITKMGSVEAWLPKGMWFDFFEGLRYNSKRGRKIRMFRTLDKFPVLAKAGAIVPMAEHKKHDNKLGSAEEMNVIVFPGADNTFTLYEDEGDYSRFKDGAFAKTEMTLNWGEEAVFTIKPAVGDLSLIPESRKWNIKLRGFNRNIEVKVLKNGKPIDVSAKLCKATNTTTVSVDALPTDEITVVVTGTDLIHDNCDYLERAERIIALSQLRYATKAELNELIHAMWRPLHSRCWRVSGYSIEEQRIAYALIEMMTLNKGEFE